jgi:lipopolysaccharide export LptBFGC system permease protein LptF
MIAQILDRYILREWLKIFVVTAFGFPLIVLLIELADNLDDYLVRGLEPGAIALAYVFSLPDKIFLILPAAVLFATVFSLGSMSRHSELAAAKASGRSFYRMFVPIFFASVMAAGTGFMIGEVAPPATRRHLELLGEQETRSSTSKYNFVYRAEQGWTYAIRVLEVERNRMRDVLLEREGTGLEYPTLAVQARNVQHDTTTGGWTLDDGRFRIITGESNELSFAYDSMQMRSLAETPPWSGRSRSRSRSPVSSSPYSPLRW